VGAMVSDKVQAIFFLFVMTSTLAVVIANRMRNKIKSERKRSFIRFLSFFIGAIFLLMFVCGFIYYVTALHKLDS
jgi:uncharacterized membrane protein required for colicin V production